MSLDALQEAVPFSSQVGQEVVSWMADHLQAVVLLSGSVRQSKLITSIQRSILDLPLDDSRTVLDRWLEQSIQLAEILNLPAMRLRVMINGRGIAPADRLEDGGRPVHLSVETDAAEYRGTGGVLKDLSAQYDDDGLILVANGPQVLIENFSDIALELARQRADVGLLSHDDGTPSGMMLVRCGVLRMIADVGFVDMKEQALPQIARDHHVAVVRRRSSSCLPIRSLGDYTAALRAYHSQEEGGSMAVNPFAEDWRATFSIIEPGAQVDPSARVHDSVVLKGATVRRSAVIVRSLVCPGATVGIGQTLTNRLVTATGGNRLGS